MAVYAIGQYFLSYGLVAVIVYNALGIEEAHATFLRLLNQIPFDLLEFTNGKLIAFGYYRDYVRVLLKLFYREEVLFFRVVALKKV